MLMTVESNRYHLYKYLPYGKLLQKDIENPRFPEMIYIFGGLSTSAFCKRLHMMVNLMNPCIYS